MRGRLIVNSFLQMDKFEKFYSLYKDAFEKKGVPLIRTGNAEALSLLEKKEDNCDFIIFSDKDTLLSERLEKCGYKLFNSAFALETCDDKAKTYLALFDSGIKQPETIICPFWFNLTRINDYSFFKSVGEKLGYPLIVKERRGSFGLQVYLCENFESLCGLINKIGHSGIIFQKFIAESKGRDVRVQVVGNKVVACAMRKSANGDFRSNSALGGVMTEYTCDKQLEEIAVSACKAVKADFAGVDVLLSNDGYLICEVNSNAQFLHLNEVAKVNCADYIADYVISKCR